MTAEHHLTFGPFRLHRAPDRLWQGVQAIDLRPRSLAMLRYLVEHPGRLVTKAELRQHVWAGTHVSDTVLRVCVQEIRAALSDAAAAPRYLETVGRQGYRFLGGEDRERPALFTTDATGPIVGRQDEVEALERCFQRAAHGARQVVFVSGEAGVGKTDRGRVVAGPPGCREWGAAGVGQVHRRIGVRLETGYGAQAGQIATQLAVHFERGGEIQRAVHYWQQAGDNAARRNAYPEALAHLTTGLELLATLPDGPARARHELTLQLLLGGILIVSKGMTLPEVSQAYTRAQALCQQVGEPVQHCQALWGLVQFYRARVQLHTASELGQQLLHLAQSQADPVHTLEAHRLLGVIAFYRGELRTSQAHLEHSLRLSTSGHSSTPLFVGEHDPRLRHSAWSMRVLWALGYADQAQQLCREAEALVQQENHMTNIVFVANATTLLAQYRRDTAATLAGANALMAAAAAQGFGRRAEYGRILRGWALAMQGEAEAGLVQLQQGLTATQAVGPTPYSAYFLTLLAEAYGQAGQPETGLQVLAGAATLMATTDGRWWEAERYRLQGELLLHLPHPDVRQAEACFHQALAVAHAQQARALELRAAISLSRLWQQQGQPDAACQLLTPLYSWFTEGFATPDLHEARV